MTDFNDRRNAGVERIAPPETQRRRRGHDFWPPADELARIPAFYATESRPIEDKVLWLHYFVGGCDWWVAELDCAAVEAFGYACLDDPQNAEWGYVDLAELEAVAGQDLWIVERDLHWRPTNAGRANLPGRWS
jgi:hypothetical protein